MPVPLRLTVFRGQEEVGNHHFDRDIIKIGRLGSAHLKLEDPKVSRIHAVIEAASDGQTYSIIDMGSTEGTFLNDRKVSKEKLRDGDVLRLGDCRISVAYSGAQAAVAPPAAAAVAPPPPPVTTDMHTGDVVAAQQMAPMPSIQPGQAEQMVQQELAASAADPMAQVATGQITPAMPGYPMPAQPAYPMAPGASGQMPVYPQQGQMPAYPVMPGVDPQAVASGIYPTPPPASGVYPAYDPSQQSYVGVPQQGYADPAQSFAGYPPQYQAWGSAPNNLASDGVPENERALEVKLIWGSSVVETHTFTNEPQVTMGDDRKVVGKGPFQKVVRCDIEVPSAGLPAASHLLAESINANGTNYVLNLTQGMTGHIERADGQVVPLENVFDGSYGGAEAGNTPGGVRYTLQAEETIYLVYEHLVLQIRYVRRTRLVPLPLSAELNYTWLNVFVLAAFFHILAVVSFVAMPQTNTELIEDLFKNPNRFASFRLTPEQKRKAAGNMLDQLKAGEAAAKAKGSEGKAGRKDYKKKSQGRMSPKGDPSKKELARSTLQAMFGRKGNSSRSQLFGRGGLGGSLNSALGGVTGARVGDAAGLGGLGTRGTGPGGGGLSMSSVGLGALGTAGRGGGGDGKYGQGAGGLGGKKDRDITIGAGSPIIRGSLDKELIRRVIRRHMAQIRYCYEKELVRSPGLFGKVGTQFVISAKGTVQSADVAQSTLKNAEVERCITAKIRTWKFPKPKGGGIVVVKYPFIFKTSG